MTSIHNPKIEVSLREGKIEVKELSWPDALTLYNKLLTQTRAFIDDKGQFAFDLNKVISVVQENIDIGTWLVLTSTGKDQNWLMQRSVSEVLDVAAEAAVLNVGIIIERIKNARSRLRAITAGENETRNMSSGGSTAPTPTTRSS